MKRTDNLPNLPAFAEGEKGNPSKPLVPRSFSEVGWRSGVKLRRVPPAVSWWRSHGLRPWGSSFEARVALVIRAVVTYLFSRLWRDPASAVAIPNRVVKATSANDTLVFQGKVGHCRGASIFKITRVCGQRSVKRKVSCY